MNKFEKMTLSDLGSSLIKIKRSKARLSWRDYIAERAAYMRRERFGLYGTPDLATLDRRCANRAPAEYRASNGLTMCCFW